MLQELEQALKNTKRTRSIRPCTFIKTSINNIRNILRSHSLVADSLRSPLTFASYTLFQYFIILFIIFVVMLVGGILCYVFRQRVQTTMQQEMLRTIRFYGEDRSITRAWDDLQEGVRPRAGKRRHDPRADLDRYNIIFSLFSFQLHCCGVTTYDDWRQYKIDGIIPSSCCKEINGKVIRRRLRPVELTCMLSSKFEFVSRITE